LLQINAQTLLHPHNLSFPTAQKQDSLQMFKKLLIPTDGSDIALRAATMGVTFAKEQGAEVVFLHAIVPSLPPYSAEYDLDGRIVQLLAAANQEASAKILAETTAVAESHCVKSSTIAEVASRPEKLIEATVKRLQCDLIVIATHGRGGFGRFVMGSVAARLLPIASVPVLVYRDQNMIDTFYKSMIDDFPN
jgi:nucleotide-binding universal stress UspA family protein